MQAHTTRSSLVRFAKSGMTAVNCHPKVIAEGSQNKILKQVQDDKYVSEAHSKELNVLTSYRLNDFKKKAGAMHVDMSANIRRAAFTLAEVLITLGIIGVVAAMTIPTLIANYKQKTLDNQFKKTYSMISQVLLRVKGDFGYTPQCYNINAAGYKMAECKEFKEKFLEKLKVSRICETKGFENGCIPEYNGVDTVLKNEHKDDENYDEDYWQDYASRNCGGFTQSQILNNRKVYVLADGTILFFYNSEQDADSIPVFAMDINGKTGPNKWGHDLFGFMISIDGNNNLQVAASGCMRAEDGGLYTADMIDKLFH